MRAGRVTAMVLVGLLAGCGTQGVNGTGEADKAAPRSSAPGTPTSASASPAASPPGIVPPTGAPTAPGVDSVAPSQRTFTGAQLDATLLPDSAFGRGLDSKDQHQAGVFKNTHEQRRGWWSYCLESEEDPAWLGPAAYRGTEAYSHSLWTNRRTRPPQGHIMVSQHLVSLTTAAARDLHRVEQDILRHCPEFGSDMEAGTATERYRVEPLKGLGDEANLEVQEIVYEGDTRTSYRAHVRVGGVLVRVESGEDPDRDATVRWAAQLARDVRGDLYGISR
ncbi:hypothetical protein [Streptomyces sp. NPDC057694]|uniref:hypothetical protein n=1 Tax=Streptomyces sp. NPDC057694 TaxID=3346216 RepID=UPI0036A26644